MKITTIKQTLPEDQVSPEIIQKIKNRGRVPQQEIAPVDASAITLQQVATHEEFTALEGEWDEFLLRTQTPSPFLSWDYIDVWWEVYGDKGFDVKFYIARDAEGNLVGAIPLMISQKGAFAGARSKFRHLSFVGGVGDLLGEYLEIPALKGYEVALGEAAAELVMQKFQGLWDVLYLYLVPHDSRSTNTMLRHLAKAGVGIKTAASLESPIMPITGTWEEACQKRSKNTRNYIRRMYPVSRNKFLHERHVVGEDIEFEEGYEELVRLAETRWGKEKAQAFHTPEFVDFHWKLAPRFLAKQQLHFGLVSVKNQYAGAVYDFIFDDKKWGYQIPWDCSFSDSQVGNILNVWSLADAHERGLREVDFLPGDSGIKDRWAKYHRVLNIYEAACPTGMGGTLFSIARGLDRMLKQKEKPATIPSHD